MNIKKFFKRYWLVIVVVIFSLVLLGLYLKTFNGGLTNEHSRWGEFGSFFGSLTGLLAFMGVIITLIQSRRQVMGSEERETFFSLLEIFREHRKNVIIEKANIVNKPVWPERQIVPNENLSGDRAFAQIGAESNFYLLDEIISNAPHFITEEEMMSILPPEIQRQEKDIQRREAIQALYITWNTTQRAYPEPPVGVLAWKDLAYEIIQLYIRREKYDALTDAMLKTGNTIYSLYKNQLGPYFRNIFYLFDTITKYEESNKYDLLFRAQLSKDELIVVFFNSFSSESNPIARKYYFDSHLFNNLPWKDVSINQDLKNVDGKLLSSLYDAANKK